MSNLVIYRLAQEHWIIYVRAMPIHQQQHCLGFSICFVVALGEVEVRKPHPKKHRAQELIVNTAESRLRHPPNSEKR